MGLYSCYLVYLVVTCHYLSTAMSRKQPYQIWQSLWLAQTIMVVQVMHQLLYVVQAPCMHRGWHKTTKLTTLHRIYTTLRSIRQKGTVLSGERSCSLHTTTMFPRIVVGSLVFLLMLVPRHHHSLSPISSHTLMFCLWKGKDKINYIYNVIYTPSTLWQSPTALAKWTVVVPPSHVLSTLRLNVQH